MTDAERLKDARRRLGLKQRELAALLGYESRITVTHIEAGRQRLSGAARMNLALHLTGRRLHFWATIVFSAPAARIRNYAIRRYYTAYEEQSVQIMLNSPEPK